MAVDAGILNSDLLYLPQDLPSPSGKPATEKLLDDLFSQWLSLPDAQRVVRIITKTVLYCALISPLATFYSDSAHLSLEFSSCSSRRILLPCTTCSTLSDT
jgi:hypothetical protein